MIRKIKNALITYAKSHRRFRLVLRKCRYIEKRAIFLKSAGGQKTQENLVYFRTFSGRSYGDSPKAIYLEMLKNPKYDKYQFLWGFKEPEDYKFLEENPRTKVVKLNTSEHDRFLGKAKYWISNYRMLDHEIPKKDQVYVQCWHGTPLKRLGYDLKSSDNAMNSTSEIYDKYRTDAYKFSYLISPSRFTTEKFASAWNLKEFGMLDKILETGYPRNDSLTNTTADEVQDIKKALGISKDQIGDKKIILYAPTWRDNQHVSGLGYVYDNPVDFDLLRKELEGEYIILFRAHYLVANEFDFDKYKGFIYDVSDHDDINELYLASDLLITDYSSVFFDYSILKKPIIFYMYDLEYYRDDLRGFYISIDELPGNIVKTEKELAGEIKSVKEWKPDKKYQEFNKTYTYLEDGHATERVCEAVFK